MFFIYVIVLSNTVMRHSRKMQSCTVKHGDVVDSSGTRPIPTVYWSFLNTTTVGTYRTTALHRKKGTLQRRDNTARTATNMASTLNVIGERNSRVALHPSLLLLASFLRQSLLGSCVIELRHRLGPTAGTTNRMSPTIFFQIRPASSFV